MKEKGGVIVKVVVAIVILMIIIGGAAFIWYSTNIKPVQEESEEVIVEISYGTGIKAIASQLEEANVIRNANAFMIYCKVNNRTLIKAGKYQLNKNMTISEILDLVEEEKVVDETVQITFPEGINMRKIASIIAENTENEEEDVFELIENEEYIDGLIEKYWFITDEIKNEDIYYSLEGYLYPDTYEIANKEVKVETIFEKMLTKMDTILTPYKEQIDNQEYSIHEILTLASIVELEAQSQEDRATVAGVFYNRLDKNMALQSDVTAYYGLKLAMDERDLTLEELEEDNGYNTRASSMEGELPVGPICIVSQSAIDAVLNPTDTDALYFVADINGDIYFSETHEEHLEIQEELKEEGLWYTYDN